jgi:predicted 3-demethylubiquinone-9 3-methyltransferase (glyoxalase superfamily)
MATLQRIQPCLWFADEGEEAARFYTGIFPSSRIVKIARYGKAGFEAHRRPEGSVMTVDFELDGQRFLALQVVPTKALELLSDPSSPKSQRAFAAMMNMKKLDLPGLEKAYNG